MLCPAVSCSHEVDIYEGRQWVGGKVASFTDKDGNHIEVGVLSRRGGAGPGFVMLLTLLRHMSKGQHSLVCPELKERILPFLPALCRDAGICVHDAMST
jgi:hypothetical protein